jgi:hypothetical protein
MGQIIANSEQFETYIEADHRGQILQKGPDSGMFDAFGRQRFSEPFTLLDSMLRYSKRTDLWNEKLVASGATKQHGSKCHWTSGLEGSGISKTFLCRLRKENA